MPAARVTQAPPTPLVGSGWVARSYEGEGQVSFHQPDSPRPRAKLGGGLFSEGVSTAYQTKPNPTRGCRNLRRANTAGSHESQMCVCGKVWTKHAIFPPPPEVGRPVESTAPCHIFFRTLLVPSWSWPTSPGEEPPLA